MTHKVSRKLCLLALLPLVATACETVSGAYDGVVDVFTAESGPARPVDVGLASGYAADLVADGFTNPSGLSFSAEGALAVCDSGNGRVVLVDVDTGAALPYVTGFATEYWKVDKKTGTKQFKLGPLSCLWLGGGMLAVTDAGLPDGEEVVRFYSGPGTVTDGRPTNPVGPTTDDPADKGEGNLTGMARAPVGIVYVCGQGSDAATWILRTHPWRPNLETFASADAAGITVNSPMQCLAPGGRVLVLYSGKGGADDGLIAAWDEDSGALLGTWTLPGLTDPMGMAFVPGTDELVVVDNNWSLTDVKEGRLARVTLPTGGGEAKVTVIGTRLQGPVSCTFGPDGRLYVAELGARFDEDLGRVIAISGF